MSYPPAGSYPPSAQGGSARPIYIPSGQPSPRPQGVASVPPAKVRGQRPEDPPASERRPEPKPVALTLPPPEQLGIGAKAPAAEIDMNVVHRRLRELGSQSYQLQRTPEGYRFTCLLPTAHPDRTQRIEAQGATEAEAVRLALARAEQWAQGK